MMRVISGGNYYDDKMSVLLLKETGAPGGNHGLISSN